MKYKESDGNLIISELRHFDIAQIFGCGQNFRFEHQGGNVFKGVAFGEVLTIEQNENNVILHDISEQGLRDRWLNFFALDEDYDQIRSMLDTDEFMHRALEYGMGIRILKQDLWEMLISFIISQNNNIPRIRKIVRTICDTYGSAIANNAQQFRTFPTIEQMERITCEDLLQLGLGYRAAYVEDAVKKIAWGEIDLNKLRRTNTCDARQTLMGIKGVGGKVADCIMLFGMSRYEVCPHDVWVKRIFTEKYGIEHIDEKKGYLLAEAKWGKYAGIAQQFLFYCERENSKTSAK